MTAPESDGPRPLDALAAPLAAAGIVNRFAPGLAAGSPAPVVAHGLRLLAERSAAGRPVPDRVCWSRISYRQHFRPPVALREIHHANGTRSRELTVDLGQMASRADLERRIGEALDGPLPAPGIDIGSYGCMGGSPIWDFNAAFWRHLPGYMAAVGRGVRDSIGGSPDSDQARTGEHARRFCALVRGARTSAGTRPARPLAYLDVGAADTGYAETMIRHLAAARLTPVDYLVADSSPGALRRARARLGQRHGTVAIRYVQFDLSRRGHSVTSKTMKTDTRALCAGRHFRTRQPAPALAAYRGRILTVHLTNLLDNLPGEELVQVGGRHYLLHTCLYLPAAALERLAARHRLDRDRLATDLRTIATDGVDPFLANYRNRFAARCGADGERRWYLFWQDLFGNPDDRGTGLKLRERLVEVADAARIAPWQAPAEVLAPGPDRRIPLSDHAIGACLHLIALLHPRGVLEITDVMIRDRGGAAPYAAYHGPAKYDGSVVNWFNGGLLMQLARRAYPGCRATWRSLAGAGKAHMICLEVRRSGASGTDGERRPRHVTEA